MIAILILQVQSFVLPSLLLMCGDIESNPGPLHSGKSYI